jgi:hypothetical protein
MIFNEIAGRGGRLQRSLKRPIKALKDVRNNFVSILGRQKKDYGAIIDPVTFEETQKEEINLIKTCSSNLQILSWPYTIGPCKLP